MGWLDCTPEKVKKSRLSEMLDRGEEPSDLEIDDRMIEVFNASGRCLYGYSGVIPLTWSEISAFSLSSPYDLTPWERMQLWKMSSHYCLYFNDKTNGKINPSLSLIASDENKLQAQRDAVAAKMRSLRNLRKNSP